jgi:hypothetical protein
MQRLDTLPGVSARAINNHGDVVGSSGWGPFLYTDASGMIDLRSRIVLADQRSYSLGEAIAISDAGHIALTISNGSGLGTARLTPLLYNGPTAQPAVDVPVLTPPDGRMILVTVDPHVGSDPYDPEPICHISHVVNSEHPATGPDPDVSIDTSLNVRLRATRLGTGPGRSYTLIIGCADRIGASTEASVAVIVPHDAR